MLQSPITNLEKRWKQYLSFSYLFVFFVAVIVFRKTKTKTMESALVTTAAQPQKVIVSEVLIKKAWEEWERELKTFKN